MGMETDNLIVEKTTAFSLGILEFVQQLNKFEHKDIRAQILKSGTSIGANVMEAQGPESNADFIHKMKIAYKESMETKYWLHLCEKSDHLPSPQKLSSEIESIIRIIGKIIGSSKKGGK